MARICAFTYDTRLDRRVVLQCDGLIARGHQVTLYAVPSPDAANDPAYVRRLDQLTNGATASPSTYSRVVAIKRWLEAKLPGPARGLVPLARRLFWSGYQWFVGKQAVLVFAEPFEAILTEAIAADLYIAYDLPMLPVAVRAKQRFGGKLLYDSHELFPDQGFSGREERQWRALESALIGQADCVVTINPSVAGILQQRYGLSQVHSIYNADLLPSPPPARGRRFHQRLALPQEARILLYQGRFSLDRNLDVLVRMMPHLNDTSLHLVFLGNGPAGDRLARLVQQLGLSRQVHFIDTVPQAELIAYTASADLGLIPYQDTCLNNRYCTPNKLFEFVIAALPAVASDLPELRRLYAEYGIGLSGNTADPERLAALVQTALEPARWQALHAATLRARDVLNWQQEGAKFVQILEATLQPATAAIRRGV